MRRDPDVNHVQLVSWTRSALSQLYDSPALGSHPLAQLLTQSGGVSIDAAQNLRRVLLDCIAALQPKAGTPSESPDRRMYRILEARYIACASPEEAMASVALQKSQFYYYQAQACEALAAQILQRCPALQKSLAAAQVRAEARPESDDNLVGAATQALVEHSSRQQVDMESLLTETALLLAPLATQKEARLIVRSGTASETLHASRVPLRQAVLNALTYALDLSVGGEVQISTFHDVDRMGILVRLVRAEDHLVATDLEVGQNSRRRLCETLMATMGGRFAVEHKGKQSCLVLAWPLANRRTLLVIDDNEGFSSLYSRYTVDRGWRVIKALNGTEARAIIEADRPSVILLDVLMPDEDGWELLVSLKSGAPTRQIPVIVCSVLRESQLARTLGADAYLVKPVTEESLVAALAPYGA